MRPDEKDRSTDKLSGKDKTGQQSEVGNCGQPIEIG